MNFHNFLPIESTFQEGVDRSICVGGGGEGTTGDEGGGEGKVHHITTSTV